MTNPRVRAVVSAVWAVVLIAVTVWAVSRSDDETVSTASDSASSHSDPSAVHRHPNDSAASGDSVRAPGVRVRNGHVVGEPAMLEVNLGERVVLDVVTDETDEVHVHGYDISVAVAADKKIRVEFVADIPGEFDLELEESHLPIARLRVR